jgi:tetratricopeptide (TPR) repeat protein
MKRLSNLILISFLFVGCLVHKTPDYYIQRAKSEALGADYDAASKDFHKAIKLKPDCYDCYVASASAYLLADSIDAAIKDYKSAMSIKRGGEIYYLLANAYYRGTYDTLACKYWEMACDLNYNVKSCNYHRLRCK